MTFNSGFLIKFQEKKGVPRDGNAYDIKSLILLKEFFFVRIRLDFYETVDIVCRNTIQFIF